MNQYTADEAIQIRIDTHQRYGTANGEPMFRTITRAMREVRPQPSAILDVGAGTGNWYRAIRADVGPEPCYTGLDQSPGMVDVLAGVLGGDSRGKAVVGDAEALPFADAKFPWVGWACT